MGGSQGYTSGMPVQADMRSLVFNLAVASGDKATYKAVQQLYLDVRPHPPCPYPCLLFNRIHPNFYIGHFSVNAH